MREPEGALRVGHPCFAPMPVERADEEPRREPDNLGIQAGRAGARAEAAGPCGPYERRMARPPPSAIDQIGVVVGHVDHLRVR